MAFKKPAAKKAPPKPDPSKSRALTTYDERLAALARKAADTEQHVGAGIKFFSFKGGKMRFDEKDVPDSVVAVVVLDALILNTYYEGDYDPNDKRPPVCFAYGYDEKALAPVAESKAKQSEACEGCPMNEFGTADRGKGKACKNTRRLLVIPGGTLKNGELEPFTDDELREAELCGMALPPTSLQAWARYTKELQSQFNRPPLAFITEVKVIGDDKDMFHVEFRALAEVEDESTLGVLLARSDAAVALNKPLFLAGDDNAAKPKDGKRAAYRRAAPAKGKAR